MTDELRAISRKKKIIKTFSVGAYSKAVGVVVSFAIVPLAVNYLGADGYGLWVAASSLIALLSFADGGAGNALLNMVSHATGANSKESLKSIVSSGFFVLLSMSIIGGLLFLLLTPYVNWAWVFGIAEGVPQPELLSLVLIVGLAFFIGMPFSVVGNVQRGFQEGNIQAFWDAKARLLSLVFVFASIQLDLGLIGFALAVVSGPIVAALGNNIYYFLLRKKDLLPTLSSVKRTDVNAVLGTGGLFFVLQITSSIQMSADKIIIANMLGPTSVTQYAICMQLFMVVPMAMGLLWAPLWPAYREAMASGDVEWVKRMFFKSIKLALAVCIPVSITLVSLGQEIICLWVGKGVVPSVLLLLGCGLWMIMVVVGNAMAVLLNGLQVIKIQIIVAVSTGILNVGLSIWLIKVIGVEGAAYGSVISYLVCAIIPYFFFIPKFLRTRVRVEF